jgi:hypothetical protein
LRRMRAEAHFMAGAIGYLRRANLPLRNFAALSAGGVRDPIRAEFPLPPSRQTLVPPFLSADLSLAHSLSLSHATWLPHPFRFAPTEPSLFSRTFGHLRGTTARTTLQLTVIAPGLIALRGCV